MTYNTHIHLHYLNPTLNTRKHIEHTYKIVPYANEKKLKQLISSSNNKGLCNLGKYLYYANKHRTTCNNVNYQN